MHHLPLPEEPGAGASTGSRRVLGVTADGTMWIYHLVQFAGALLNQPKHVQSSRPFSPEQRQAWDRWGGLSDSTQIIFSQVLMFNSFTVPLRATWLHLLR